MKGEIGSREGKAFHWSIVFAITVVNDSDGKKGEENDVGRRWEKCGNEEVISKHKGLS